MSIDQMLWRQTIGLMMTTCCKKTRTTTNHRCRFLSIGSLTEFDLLNEAASAICWDHKLSFGLMTLLMFSLLDMFSCGGHVMVSKFCEKILKSRGFELRKPKQSIAWIDGVWELVVSLCDDLPESDTSVVAEIQHCPLTSKQHSNLNKD